MGDVFPGVNLLYCWLVNQSYIGPALRAGQTSPSPLYTLYSGVMMYARSGVMTHRHPVYKSADFRCIAGGDPSTYKIKSTPPVSPYAIEVYSLLGHRRSPLPLAARPSPVDIVGGACAVEGAYRVARTLSLARLRRPRMVHSTHPNSHPVSNSAPVSPSVERITFVDNELDQGKEVTNWLISHISKAGACGHNINQRVFNIMQTAGVQRMICPECGVKCVIPAAEGGRSSDVDE